MLQELVITPPAVNPGYDHHLFTPQTESNKNLSQWHLWTLVMSVSWLPLKQKEPRISYSGTSGIPWPHIMAVIGLP